MERLPDLDGLQSFLLVAEELSFRRAAERLNLDQSALSRRIKELESRMGVLLFRRTTREVRLTEAGQAFYERNAQLLDDLRDSVSLARRTADGQSGRLRIGYMSFAAVRDMPACVAQFRASYPAVSLDLLYFQTQAQKLQLARGQLDVGFLIGPFEHPDFATALISEEPLVALLSDDHPAAARGAISLAELAASPLVLGTMAQWDFYRQMLDLIFVRRGLAVKIAFEASSTMGILGLVAAGLGSTIFPACAHRLRTEGIKIVEILDCETPIRTLVAWRRHEVPSALQNFLRVCGAAD